MLALSIPIEGKRLPGRILIFTVCLTGNVLQIQVVHKYTYGFTILVPQIVFMIAISLLQFKEH